MTRAPILLVGAGGHARACIDVLEQEGTFLVAGLLGLAHEVGTQVLGYAVLGTDADLPALLGSYAHALIGLGQIKTPEPRIRAFELLQQQRYSLPVIVSPKAYVSRHATLGAGSIVMHGAVVNAGAVIGRNCIINTQSLIEHDAVIEDHCHVATGAAINGGAHIGTGTFVGSNSTVREAVKIGSRCIIGMGMHVFADCEPGTRKPPPKGSS